MTEQLSSFEGVELTTNDESVITHLITTDTNPASAGLSAPVGSLALSTNGKTYYKHNTADTDWVTAFTQLPNELASLVPQKITPTTADRILIEDSESTFQKRYISLQSLSSWIEENSGHGLDFSRRGNISATTVLLTRDGILSSSSGHPIGISNPVMSSVNVSTRLPSSYTIRVFQHDGDSVNRIDLADVVATNTTNLRAIAGIDFTQLATITSTSQLAVELIAGTARDIMVEVVLLGSLL
jgi:hypothetical protein